MILPSKHLSHDRALLTVGGMILRSLTRPMTVSALWDEMVRSMRDQIHGGPKAPSGLRYHGFVLALDLLYLLNTIELRDGLLYRRQP